MNRITRFLLFLGGCAIAVMAAAFFFQHPLATGAWLWPDSRLSYIFIASILAAVAAAMIWIGLSGDSGSLPAGAANIFVMQAGMAGFLYLHSRQTGQPQLLPYAAGVGLLALLALGLFLLTFRQPAASARRMPLVVRISFGIFVVLLLLAGGALVLKTGRVMPWPLKPESSVMFGWIFLGDAFYFLYALLRPYWTFGRAQLWSFLVYDLVLMVPFLDHLQRVPPELLPSLVFYLLVLIFSGGLAAFYLFIHKPTRVWTGEVVKPVQALEGETQP